MMIGGNDLVVPSTLTPALQRTALLLYLTRQWPQGVLEEEDTDGPDDFFFYKDQASYDAWNGTEADPTTHSMAYVLPRRGYCTIAHCGLDEADLQRILEGAEQPVGTN